MNDIHDAGYTGLANAIICQAVEDYLDVDNPLKKLDKSEIEEFFYSDWFKVLTDISAEYILERIG